MAKFMSAALILVRDNLSCGHCLAMFKGTDSQAWKVKYEKANVYCSDVCRVAAFRNKICKPIPNRGACNGCGVEFFSRTAKLFCTMKCYLGSSQYKAMMVENLEKSRTLESVEKRSEKTRKGMYTKCLECSEEFYQKRASKSHQTKKLCSRVCYRAYMSKRFDRWIANPQGMALPQCYDEFLDKEELECIVDGCTWRGHGLTAHVSMIHGMPATDFKRAVGFNLTTGVISKTLATALSNRANVGIALKEMTDQERELALIAAIATMQDKDRIRYKSKEGKEHRQKSYALLSERGGVNRICKNCKTTFTQHHVCGKQLYCTASCRDRAYANTKKALTK